MAPRPPQPGADDDFIVGRIHHHWLGLELPGEKTAHRPHSASLLSRPGAAAREVGRQLLQKFGEVHDRITRVAFSTAT